MSLGSRLRNLREEKGLRQEDLGKYFNVGKSTISHWESDFRVPDPNTVLKLAKYFGVSTDYLLGNDTPGKAPDKVEEDWPEAISVLRRAGRKPTAAERRRIAKIIEVAIEDTDED